MVIRSPRIVPHRLETRLPAASRSSALETPTKLSAPVIVTRTRIVTIPPGSPVSLKSCSMAVQANSLLRRWVHVPCCLLAALLASEPMSTPPRAHEA